MSDLISKKALLDYLGKKFINVNYHPDLGDPAVGMEQELFNEFLSDMLNEINNRPTAYDVDKVVEELEKLKQSIDKVLYRPIEFNEVADKFIEIVKGAVKDE